MKGIFHVALCTALLTSIALGQTAFMQIMPGKSSKADAARVFGTPITSISDTLLEYRAKGTGQKIYVQYSEQANIIDRIEVIYAQPVARTIVTGTLKLQQKPDVSKWDSKGRLEEYFGADKLVVITHETSEIASPIYRVGYYSSELFAVALEKPSGTPRRPPPPPTVPGGSVKGEAKSFKNVDLLVPKGDKSESKSVRLLFDGRDLIIDADRGEKIYKQFPYGGIVSAEYSYSSSPRWKTAIGAAILIGVFALPIFFMKSKKHWLTVKTANDFAILRLDKDNYRTILATFETTTGRKVEIVGDGK